MVNRINHHQKIIFLALMFLLSADSAFAQATAFTYQGKLNNNGTPADGVYDFEFRLFDLLSGGTQQGTTLTLTSVAVANGIFTVQLDFGACASCFNGAARFLDISVRVMSGGAFTPLTPRQPVNATPYAIQSLNAAAADGLSLACVSCVTSSQIQSVSGSVVTGAIPVASLPAGSGNYIQNTTTQQAASHFNISDDGTVGGTLSANAINAMTQFNLAGNRVLSVSGASGFANSNTFAGVGAGTSTTPDASGNGRGNSFFGNNAGFSNTTGNANSFFGWGAGNSNTTGSSNSFFGWSAGLNNTTGNANAFFGHSAGGSNTTGGANAFFGENVGARNSTGHSNAFFGQSAGLNNVTGFANAFFGESAGFSTTGSTNAFFGKSAGFHDMAGFGNTFIGHGADFNTTNTVGYNNTLLGASTRVSSGLSNATAIGTLAQVTQSNSLILGSINGVNGATADTNVGIGTTAPSQRLHVVGNGLFTGSLTVNGTLNATLPIGSGNYIQSNPISQQSASFNINGNGTVGQTLTGNIVIATTQFNIGADRILSNAGSENLFAGANAGIANTSGIENAFFGDIAGAANDTGSGNSFFGFEAGRFTTGGSNNSFFGSRAASQNATGNFNSFFGHRAGELNSNGSSNSFFGTGAGLNNEVGSRNSFFGHDAGNTNWGGSLNTIIGDNADVSFALNPTNNATAIGANALVSQSNSLVLGSINGVNGATAATNVGIGVTAPANKLQIVDSSNTGLRVQNNTAGGTVASFGGNGAFQVDAAGIPGGRFYITEDDKVGIGTIAPEQKLHVVGNEILSTGSDSGFKFRDRGSTSSADDWVWYSTGNVTRFFRSGVGDLLTITTAGVVTLNGLGSAGGTSLCRNVSNQIANCSSSRRYKTNVATLHTGLSLINRLRPVTFDWKQGGEHDLGLVAEEVAKVEPLLVSHNDKGKIEGVKYDRVGVLLINAVKEQQTQIAVNRPKSKASTAPSNDSSNSLKH